MVLYPTTFLLALGVTMLVTPFVARYAQKIGAVDHPSERKIHKDILPRLGGLAIFAGFISAVLFGVLIAFFTGVHINLLMMGGILLASIIILITGVVDDIKGIRPWQKLIGQGAAAVVVMLCGVQINFFTNPFSGTIAIGFLAIPLTILWLVGLTNAINLIDGLDGLAAGVTAISAGALFFVALRTHQISAALLMLALAGAAVGFLRYNFFPAKIFLGDSGSLLLGFILAASSIVGVFKTTLVVALFIPILILGVPIFDTLFAIGRRLKEKKHPFEADKKHIHHLLLRAGFNQREAVFAIYIACFLLSITALLMAMR